MFKKYKALPVILIATILLAVVLTGCTTQGPQGWSACSSNGTNIYYGSMDSRVICINPSSRALGLSFPDPENGEWYATIRGPATGGMCGFGCAPASTVAVIYSTPLISNELVYETTYTGKVYAYNMKTGAERWIYPRESSESIGGIVGNIIGVENTIYLTTSAGTVYALDMTNGDRKWEFSSGDKIWTSPAYANGNIFFGSYDGKLYSISAANGKLNWNIKLTAAMSSSPVVYKDKVIFGSFDGYLYSVNQSDGTAGWKFQGNNWFWAEPLIDRNVIYAPCIDNFVYAINGDDGSLIWKYNAGGPIASRPVLIEGQLVAITEAGDLHVVDSQTGTQKQKIAIGSKTAANLYNNGNLIYIHSRDDYVYSIDISAGKILWKFKAETK